MTLFVHPAVEDITMEGVLAALADPFRLEILKRLIKDDKETSCISAQPCPNMAKSTLSFHFRILREAGLIRTAKVGVENLNTVRSADLERRFPGLLKTILKLSDRQTVPKVKKRA